LATGSTASTGGSSASSLGNINPYYFTGAPLIGALTGKADLSDPKFWLSGGLCGGKKKKKSAGQTDQEKADRKYRNLGYEANKILDVGAEIEPRWAALDRQSLMSEAKTQEALYTDIYGPLSRQQAALSNTAQRGADIQDVLNLGPEATRAFRQANPEQAALLDELNRQAQSELGMGATLDPSLLRQVQQSVRAGQAARGQGLGPSDIYTEAMTTGQAGQNLRNQRRGFATQMVGLNAQTTTDPFMAVLGRPSSALPYSTQVGAMGQSRAMNQDPFQNAFAQDIYSSNQNAYWQNVFDKRAQQTAQTSAIIGAVGSMVGGAAAAI
jgi:hypothetical protein